MSKRKLRLSKVTLRSLANRPLDGVAGGNDTVLCLTEVNCPSNCEECPTGCPETSCCLPPGFTDQWNCWHSDDPWCWI